MQINESACLIVYNLRLDEALYSCDYCNAITILKLSKRKHVLRGEHVKEFKSARSRKGFGYTHCALHIDSEILEGYGIT